MLAYSDMEVEEEGRSFDTDPILEAGFRNLALDDTDPPDPLSLPLALTYADLELLRWNLMLRAVQQPLCKASRGLAKAMWQARDKDWGTKLGTLLAGEAMLMSTWNIGLWLAQRTDPGSVAECSR